MLSAVAAGCVGGPPPELGIGSRVRVQVEGSPRARIVDGFLRSVSDDSLVVDPAGPEHQLAIARAALRTLEVYGPSPSADRTVETAAGLGYAAGSLAARAARHDGVEDDDETSLGEFAAGLLGALVVGGATSLGTGGGGDLWHTIPVSRLHAVTGGRPDGPVTISLPGSARDGVERHRGPGPDRDSMPDLDSS